MESPASVTVGYDNDRVTQSGDWYKKWERHRLAGADIVAKDGSGNIIEVHVRADSYGYSVAVNGQIVSQAV